MVFSAGGARRPGPALESMYRFVLWLVPTVEKFPRRQKFLLGDRLQEPVNLYYWTVLDKHFPSGCRLLRICPLKDSRFI